MASTILTVLFAPRSALMRALVFASPLIGILCADKALTLAAASRLDNIAPLPRTLLALLGLMLQYRPAVLLVAILGFGPPLSMLLGRRNNHTNRLVGWLLALPLGVA